MYLQVQQCGKISQFALLPSISIAAVRIPTQPSKTNYCIVYIKSPGNTYTPVSQEGAKLQKEPQIGTPPVFFKTKTAEILIYFKQLHHFALHALRYFSKVDT